jgi:hypothetical protein
MLTPQRKQKIREVVNSLINYSMKEILDNNNIKLYYRPLQNLSNNNTIS